MAERNDADIAGSLRRPGTFLPGGAPWAPGDPIPAGWGLTAPVLYARGADGPELAGASGPASFFLGDREYTRTGFSLAASGDARRAEARAAEIFDPQFGWAIPADVDARVAEQTDFWTDFGPLIPAAVLGAQIFTAAAGAGAGEVFLPVVDAAPAAFGSADGLLSGLGALPTGEIFLPDVIDPVPPTFGSAAPALPLVNAASQVGQAASAARTLSGLASSAASALRAFSSPSSPSVSATPGFNLFAGVPMATTAKAPTSTTATVPVDWNKLAMYAAIAVIAYVVIEALGAKD